LKNRGLKVGLCIVLMLGLAATAWRINDRFERGMLYPWVEALVIPDNPQDGLYQIDIAAIDPASVLAQRVQETQSRGIILPTIRINRFRALRLGYLVNSPVDIGGSSAEVCIVDGQLILTAKSFPVNYCVRYNARGTGRVFDITDNGNRLICVTCDPDIEPVEWVRLRENDD